MSFTSSSKRSKVLKDEAPLPKIPDSKRPRRGVRTSAACEACKKRKTKCSGSVPCELCRTLGTECVIDLSLDMRRKSAMQRTLDETRHHQATLNMLVAAIRDDDIEKLSNLFGFIREHETIDDAILALPDELRSRLESDVVVKLEDMIDPSLVETDPSLVETDPSLIETGSVEASLFPMALVSDEHVAQFARAAFSVASRSTNASGSFGSPLRINTLSLGHDPSAYNDDRTFWHSSLQTPISNYAFSPNSITSAGTNNEIAFPSRRPLSFSQKKARARASQNCVDIRVYSTVLNGFANGSPFLQQQQFSDFRIPIHLVQPLQIVDTSPVSRVFTDFLHGARTMLDSGIGPTDLIGDRDVIVVDLFFRDRDHNTDKFTCCSWASEVQRNFPEFDQFTRLASIALLCLLMRWLLIPTAENYHNVPEMIRPTPLQRMVPHMAGIDTCPIPAIRDELVLQLRDWVSALVDAKLSINWCHGLDGAVEKDFRSGQTRLTKAFIDHAVEYSNWSVDSNILNTFPEIVDQIRIRGD